VNTDLASLCKYIRERRATLADFMERGAVLAVAVLRVTARNAIFVRDLSDNRMTFAELASGFFGKPITCGSRR
jgi:hypothetical protein